MKTGSPLQLIASKVDQLTRSTRDFLVAPHHLRITTGEALRLQVNDGSGALAFDLTDTVHDQFSDFTGIPPAYYHRMRGEQPDLLATNLNTWLTHGSNRRLLRTVAADSGQPTARAFLSDRYRPLDNERLLAAVLPVLADEGVRVESCELTERKLYVKAVSTRITGEVRVGEVVQAGLAISNSEVGCGALSIQPLIYTLRCTNGLILEDLSLRQHHLGRRQGGTGTDAVQHLLSDETRAADDRAFFLRVRDVAKAALTEAVFTQQVSRLREAAASPIPAQALERVVEVTTKRFGLTDEDRTGVLSHLIAGGDLSRWGLCSAITRHAQDVPSYDRASDLERVGGKVVELDARDWLSLVSVN